MENIIVLAIVIVAVWFVIRSFIKESSEGGCKCGRGAKNCKKK